MIKKISGVLICIVGAVLIIIGIFGLIKAFNVFSSSELTTEGMGYAFGSIIIPLLLAVLGRWVWRKGLKFLRS
jgi:hypothetical protein